MLPRPRAMYYDGAYAPYGEPYAEAGTTDRNFTGLNQDTTANLYDAMYREHDYTQGRWISPDPAGLAAVDLTNPQSLNRYAYVMNNPVSLTDPMGLGPLCTWDEPGCNDPSDECAGIGWETRAQCAGPESSVDTWLPGPSGGGGGAASGGGGTTTTSAGGTGSTTGSVQVWSTNSLPCELTGCGQVGWPGGASGPLSGDFGANLPPPTLGQVLTPLNWWVKPGCDFGSCAGILTTAWIPDGLQTIDLKAAWEEAKPFLINRYCGSSASDAVLKGMRRGVVMGAIKGAVAGGVGGAIVLEGAGAIPGALFGAYVGAHVGLINGSVNGIAASIACSALGVYGK